MTEYDNKPKGNAVLLWFWNHALAGWWLAAILGMMLWIVGCERTQNRQALHDQAVQISRLALENAALKSKVTP